MPMARRSPLPLAGCAEHATHQPVHVNGSGDPFVDPMSTDPEIEDLTQVPRSRAIGAGAWDPAFDDADGDRTDIGVRGGP
jgi:hypothetical protein